MRISTMQYIQGLLQGEPQANANECTANIQFQVERAQPMHTSESERIYSEHSVPCGAGAAYAHL